MGSIILKLFRSIAKIAALRYRDVEDFRADGRSGRVRSSAALAGSAETPAAVVSRLLVVPAASHDQCPQPGVARKRLPVGPGDGDHGMRAHGATGHMSVERPMLISAQQRTRSSEGAVSH